MDVDIVVNVQGDEPLIDRESLSKLLEVFQEDDEKAIDLASLKTPMFDSEEITNPNNVKVITNKDNLALYFSRFPLPYPRETNTGVTYFKHIGVYAFRKQALMDFYNLPMLQLEATEKIECIRYLEYGKNIKMVETGFKGIGIDTPEDLEKAKEFFKD
jgi:3-deoxy-manno-octulosonate cytidylyltransferase (CMP-KDO synthetase)